MDLNEILVFCRVVEAGSFTKAAGLLELPKSTVSRRISQLEQRLGARLLQRTTRSLHLTDVGQAYYDRCERIVAEVEDADLTVTRMLAGPKGRLRVTAPVEFGMAYVGALVSELLLTHEELEVELDLSDRIVDMVAEGYDVAIRAGPLPDSALIARKLGEAPLVLCASPEYLDRRGRPRRPEELTKHECIIFGGGLGGGHWQLRGRRGTVEVRVTGRMRVNNFDVVRDAALAGIGIARIPAFRCAEDIRAGSLEVVLESWRLPEALLHAVYPSTRHLSPKVRAFLDLLRERLTPPPWRLEPVP